MWGKFRNDITTKSIFGLGIHTGSTTVHLRLSCQVAGGGGVRNGDLLPTGILWWISSSTSTILRICPVVVLLPVGQVTQ